MGEYVLITGADRGLGLCLVRTFLENGFFVMAGRHNKKLNDLDVLNERFGGKLRVADLDVGDDASVKRFYEITLKFTGAIDIIINNAAVLGDVETTIEGDLDFNGISNTMNINALGPLRMTNAFVPLLMKSRIRLLVNISSEAGSMGQCERNAWFGYCMSKAALNMQSVLLHNYFMDRGCRVLIIHPGWMKTAIKGVRDDEADYEPAESAVKIFGIIRNRKKYESKKPVFIDINERPLVW
jgi:NAD(P)-dependent dehydrogenase (short-subunit alcohol dehydrogenase family)